VGEGARGKAGGGVDDCIDVAEWTEEVRLSDRRMIGVWRRDRAGSSGFPNAQRCRLIDFELKYEPWGIRWYDKTSRVHVWHPQSFDVIDGVPHLVVEGSSNDCLNRPGSDYAAKFFGRRGVVCRPRPTPTRPYVLHTDHPARPTLNHFHRTRWFHE